MKFQTFSFSGPGRSKKRFFFTRPRSWKFSLIFVCGGGGREELGSFSFQIAFFFQIMVLKKQPTFDPLHVFPANGNVTEFDAQLKAAEDVSVD